MALPAADVPPPYGQRFTSGDHRNCQQDDAHSHVDGITTEHVQGDHSNDAPTAVGRKAISADAVHPTSDSEDPEALLAELSATSNGNVATEHIQGPSGFGKKLLLGRGDIPEEAGSPGFSFGKAQRPPMDLSRGSQGHS